MTAGSQRDRITRQVFKHVVECSDCLFKITRLHPFYGNQRSELDILGIGRQEMLGVLQGERKLLFLA